MSNKKESKALQRGNVVVNCPDYKVGYFCRAFVVDFYDSKTAKVKLYANKKEYKVSTLFMFKLPNPNTKPILKTKDYVMCAVRDDNDEECFVPGIVNGIQQGADDNYYSIIYYTQQQGVNIPSELIKIDKNTYNAVVDYLIENPSVATGSIEEANDEQRKETVENKAVIAREDWDGYYYEATIRKQETPDTYEIRYFNGKEVVVNESNVFFLSIDALTSELEVGNYVLAVVLNEYKEKSYVPGVIEVIDNRDIPTIYGVKYFNGVNGGNKRNEIIPINKKKYDSITDFIRRKLRKENPNLDTGGLSKEKMEKFKSEIVDTVREDIGKLNINDKFETVNTELRNLASANKRDKKDIKKEITNIKGDIQDLKEVVGNVQRPISVPKEKPQTPKRAELSLEDELRQLRDFLPPIVDTDEEVLAKWLDDGWYFKSILGKFVGNGIYEVKDSNNNIQEISRENILTMSDRSNDINVYDACIALHPNYDHSYAPGIIIDIETKSTCLVRFYDTFEGLVHKKNIYKIPLFKFEYDVDVIINKEKRWIGETVIARNALSNCYEKGKIKERVGNVGQFLIEWSQDRISVQSINHIFGRYSSSPPLVVNDYVLAPYKDKIYLPGRVIATNGDNFKVKFYENTVVDSIAEKKMFWINNLYYNDASHFCKIKKM